MTETMPGAGMGAYGPVMMLVMAAVIIVPFWFIFSKAGHPKWLSLLMVVPLVNVLLVYFLAFSRWPALEKDNRQA